MSAIMSFFILFTAIQSLAMDVAVQEKDRVLLKGLAGQVQVTAQPGAKTLRVQGVEIGSQSGQYSVVRKDSVIEIKMNELDSKKAWNDSLGKTASRKIEITGPSLPLEIHLRDGSVNLQKWTQDAKISLVNGRVTSANGADSLQISLQKGDVTVTDHKGKVSTDAYTGTSTLKNIQGDVDAQIFAGQLIIEKVRGDLSLNSSQATSKVLQSSGSLQFENGKGAVSVQGFQGRIEGQTGEGSLAISFLPESELSIKAKSGRVSVQAPSGSGASVSLYTEDGEITVPGELRVARTSSEKSVRGRLRGTSQKASIDIRSQEGSISLK